MFYEKYLDVIRTRMKEQRYIHSVNVAKEAKRLAILYGADVQKAEIAGILHDVTKEMPFDEQLQMIRSFGIILTDIQLTTPKLWHSISGAIFIKNEIGIDDEDIFNSVRYHTTGRENMSLLEKVIFVADFTGEERCYDGVERMREKAGRSLDEAILFGVQFSISDLLAREMTIDQNTVGLYNELIMKN